MFRELSNNMCLILLAYKKHPQYPTIIAANRDEFYERPTREVQFWNTSPDLLAGKDLLGGGTWMGITRSGRFSAVTNFREPLKDNKNMVSRGFLVRNYLEENTLPKEYLKKIKKYAHLYDGFNLIVGNVEKLFYYSNRQNQIVKILPGIHGLSNHLLNTSWPKVEKGKRFFSEIVSEKKSIDVEKIFTLLEDRSMPPAQLLPHTGVDPEWEKILSPLFITSPIYGTRSSTIILLDRYGKVHFFERSFSMNQGNLIRNKTRKFCFRVSS